MHRLRWLSPALAALIVGAFTHAALADDLSNHAFRIQYDGSGIRSLKRTGDSHDTDYIAANGSLGRLLVRYRTSAHGDWRELRDLLLSDRPPGGRTIGYTLGTWLPTLAARSTAGAAVGAAGLRALNDGLVPIAPPAGRGGRGAGPGPLGLDSMCRCSRGRDRAVLRSGCSSPFLRRKNCREPKCSGSLRPRRGACSIRMGASGSPCPRRRRMPVTPMPSRP